MHAAGSPDCLSGMAVCVRREIVPMYAAIQPPAQCLASSSPIISSNNPPENSHLITRKDNDGDLLPYSAETVLEGLLWVFCGFFKLPLSCC